MKASTWLAGTALLATSVTAISCGDDGDGNSTDETAAVADALTRNVNFDNGVVQTGDLPETDAPDVSLVPFEGTVVMSPGAPSVMSLSSDNPDEANDPVEATLVQFEKSDDHVEIMKDEMAMPMGEADIENRFMVGADVCQALCNKRFTIKVFEALKLRSGKIGRHVERTVVLDCSEAGDPAECPGAKGGETIGVQPDLSDGDRVIDDLGMALDAACTCSLAGSELGLGCGQVIGTLERDCLIDAIDDYASMSGADLRCADGQLASVASCIQGCEFTSVMECLAPISNCNLDLAGAESMLIGSCGATDTGTGGTGGGDFGGTGGAGIDPTQFMCRDGSYIPANLTCNGVADCPDGSDETAC